MTYPLVNQYLPQLDAHYDAFGRFRISSPTTLLDSKQLYSNLPNFWDDAEVSGSGTASAHSTATASTTLSVSTNTVGRRVRQTKQWFNYQSGKSLAMVATFISPTPASGIRCMVGYGNDNNGLFFMQRGTTLYFVIRSSTSGSPVDIEIPQSAWNVDKLDGTGQSRITLDPTKLQIFWLDLEWLGGGQVRFGFYFGGVPIVAHTVTNINTLSNVYMSSPNLPCRYEISNDGTGVASSLKTLCTTVMNEGTVEPVGVVRSATRDVTPLTTQSDTNWYPLISLRLKSTHLGTTIHLIRYSILCTSTADYQTAMFFNPTIAGTDAVNWQDQPNGAIQFDVSRDNTNFVTGSFFYGVQLQSTTAVVRTDEELLLTSNLRLGSKIDGTRDELVLAVKNLSAGAEVYYASLDYRELV